MYGTSGDERSNSVLLDTSFLICLSSPCRPHHSLATEYFRRFIGAGVTMHLSTIVISEYEVRQRVTDLGFWSDNQGDLFKADLAPVDSSATG
jgi:hypothetical protein